MGERKKKGRRERLKRKKGERFVNRGERKKEETEGREEGKGKG